MEAEIERKTVEKDIPNGTKNYTLQYTEPSTMVTDFVENVDADGGRCESGGNKAGGAVESKAVLALPSSKAVIDGVVTCAGDLNKVVEKLKKDTVVSFNLKNKRKRRRGKPKQKTNSIRPNKKSNWKWQVPSKYRSTRDEGMRPKLTRSRSIVPYNTNKFLMEEHLAEVPSALLTPSGRTRDSSFSVDSEDNYFFSLPEDEEEFLTKEFANVYERARVERLEGMTKQQLIEECLQLEDRYAQGAGAQQNGTTEFLNRIRVLEEKIKELAAENNDLRRKLLTTSNNMQRQTSGPHRSGEPMCSGISSEDSESDSSASSRSNSSCRSSEYNHRRSNGRNRLTGRNNVTEANNTGGELSRMESDELNDINGPEIVCNGQIIENSSDSQLSRISLENSLNREQHQKQRSPVQRILNSPD